MTAKSRPYRTDSSSSGRSSKYTKVERRSFSYRPPEQRFRYISGAYLFEHRHHDREYDEIEEALTALRKAHGNSKRMELAERLHREAIVFAATMDMHITKENELILPICDDHISFEEQGRTLGQAHSHLSQDLMMRIVPWMFKALNANDREGFPREGMQMFSALHFAGMAQMLSSSVSPTEWQEMVRRIPELQSLGG